MECRAVTFTASRAVEVRREWLPPPGPGEALVETLVSAISPGSELLVRDYVFEPRQARYAFSVHLAKGQAIYSSGKIGKLAPGSVKVSSPMATVGVRGTTFIIQAE